MVGREGHPNLRLQIAASPVTANSEHPSINRGAYTSTLTPAVSLMFFRCISASGDGESVDP